MFVNSYSFYFQVAKLSMLLALYSIGFTIFFFVVIAFLTTHFNWSLPYFNPNFTHREGKTTKVNNTTSPDRKSQLTGHTNTMVSNDPENDAWHNGTDSHTSTQSWRNNHHYEASHGAEFQRPPQVQHTQQPRLMRSLFGGGASYNIAGQTLHLSRPEDTLSHVAAYHSQNHIYS